MGLRVATTESAIREGLERLRDRDRIAFDLESNGMFAYRARLCLVQLAADGDALVVDTLQAPHAALAPLLGARGPTKIVHDVAFDARLLAENGLELANVHDTSVIARMLGRPATGLASLLAAELGVALDKAMQHHDWSRRPLDDRALGYLAADVVHLHALDDKLWSEATSRDLVLAIDEETRYRLATSIGSARTPDPRPPWVRVKGIDKVGAVEQSILRHLCEVREAEASRLDVPPYKVIGNETLFAIATARPASLDDLAKIRGARLGRAAPLGRRLLEAVRRGVDEGDVPADERQRFLVKPRLPPALARARRERESRLSAWRREEAKRRGVDEQAVLPGHCLQDLADLDDGSPDALRGVAGLGEFRVERDGVALGKAIAGPARGA
jgi:ribonuclease D